MSKAKPETESDKIDPLYRNRLKVVRDITNGTGDNQIVHLSPQDEEALEQCGAKCSCVKDENGNDLAGQYYGRDLRAALKNAGTEDLDAAPPGMPAPQTVMPPVEEPKKSHFPKKS